MPIQAADITGSPFAIEYSGPGLSWKILKGVEVSGTSAAVAGGFADIKLINKGAFTGTDAFGVRFDPDGAPGSIVIKNAASGHIEGNVTGVEIVDFLGPLRVKNKGRVEGSDVGLYSSGSDDVQVSNKGSIVGDFAALNIDIQSEGPGSAVVKNHGTLEAGVTALKIGSTVAAAVAVHNFRGGIISGDTNAIDSTARLSLKNDGKIVGSIRTGDHGNKIVSSGAILGDVSLREGDDVIKMKGKGHVEGLIDSGDGNDKLVLGEKSDSLLFNSALSADTNVDTIRKFESGKDALFLNEDRFGALSGGQVSQSEFRLGSSAGDADDHLIYDKSSGALYYDPDGIGGAGQIKFAQFNPGTKLKAGDIFVGDYSLELPL